MDVKDIEILQLESGNPYLLGVGSFGTVGHDCLVMSDECLLYTWQSFRLQTESFSQMVCLAAAAALLPSLNLCYVYVVQCMSALEIIPVTAIVIFYDASTRRTGI